MEKDFDTWNEQKKLVHASEDNKFFHEREIWWCSLGLNIGFEQDGKNDLFERPVLIVKKFNRSILWMLPLTRSHKENQYYYSLPQGEELDSVVILSQLRLISSKRLNRHIRKISPNVFNEIIKHLQTFLPSQKIDPRP